MYYNNKNTKKIRYKKSLNICRGKKMYLYICIEIKYTLKNDNCKVFQTIFVFFLLTSVIVLLILIVILNYNNISNDCKYIILS